MQELGGKHKENFALLMRADDIVPRAFQHLARRLRKVYKDAGKDIWISLPIVREWTPEGTFLDPSSACGFFPLPQPGDFPCTHACIRINVLSFHSHVRTTADSAERALFPQL